MKSDKKKIYLFIAVVVIVGILTTLSSFALWTVASNNINVAVNTFPPLEGNVRYTEGHSILAGDLPLCLNYLDGINTTFTIGKESTLSEHLVYASMHLKTNDDSYLAYADAINWQIRTASSAFPLASGTLADFAVGSNVMLDNIEVTTTDTSYTFYIWVDSNYADAIALAGLTIDLELWMEVRYEQYNVRPVVNEGLIPVVFDTANGTTNVKNGTKVKTIGKNDSNWYNYSEKKWANAVLVTNTSRSKYLNTSGVTVSESDILGYFVWIPRYRYKIWITGVSSSGKEQEIDIIFEGKNETKAVATQTGGYYTHPAFTFGNTELDGFWIGKFETGGTANEPKVKPDIRALVNQNISTQFATALKFAGGTQSGSTVTFNGNSTYGLTSKTDSHMLKNSEWGAVAYLSHSKYGANREVYINNSSGLYTGRSGGNVPGSTPINGTYTNQTSPTQYNSYGFYTWDGYLLNYNTNTRSSTRDLNKVASTTGNIYGVYDMSGGAYEYVMGNYNNTIGNSGFTTLPDNKYYDVYSSDVFTGTSTTNINFCTLATCGGHALNETAGWYSDSSRFVYSSSAWFRRGGYYNSSASGIFYFYYHSGTNVTSFSFRTCLSDTTINYR
mgnify:FL=1